MDPQQADTQLVGSPKALPVSKRCTHTKMDLVLRNLSCHKPTESKPMQDLESIKTTLSDLKPELEGRFHVSSIGVFGSVVRGEQHTDSDIDIIVDFSRPIGIEFIDLADLIEEKLKARVDLVSRKGIKPGYFKKIEKEISYV